MCHLDTWIFYLNSNEASLEMRLTEPLIKFDQSVAHLIIHQILFGLSAMHPIFLFDKHHYIKSLFSVSEG